MVDDSMVARFIVDRLGQRIRALCSEQSGVTAIVTGLAAMLLMGFAGVAINVSSWHVTQRDARCRRSGRDWRRHRLFGGWRRQPNYASPGDHLEPRFHREAIGLSRCHNHISAARIFPKAGPISAVACSQ